LTIKVKFIKKILFSFEDKEIIEIKRKVWFSVSYTDLQRKYKNKLASDYEIDEKLQHFHE
jgi:hypothetical protein